MKEINYNTDRLIVFNYPGGAGGKFISLCLALSPQVLHQDQESAKTKINGLMNEQYSFQISKDIIAQSKKNNSNNHFQLGCMEFAGFNDGHNKEMQSTLANNLWRELTNQRSFYFCMASHHGNMWQHYPEAYHIIFKNYEWILEARNKIIPNFYQENYVKLKKIIYFDQKSIGDSVSFKKEISKLYSFFKLAEPNYNFIEELRKIWLDSFRVGFDES